MDRDSQASPQAAVTSSSRGLSASKSSKSSKQRHHDTATTNDPPQPQLRLGSASPPSETRQDFTGRSGTWHCEQCLQKILLAPNTYSWNCRSCQTKNYTLPEQECPLDKACPCCCWDTMLTS